MFVTFIDLFLFYLLLSGVIHYYEAIIELSDSVITSIQKKETNNDVFKTMVICTANEKRNAKSDTETNQDKKLFRRETIAPFVNIPIYFMQYLFDTLEAFDLNCNGFLCKNELLQLIEVVNIPITVEDIFVGEEIEVTPKMAVTAFASIIEVSVCCLLSFVLRQFRLHEFNVI